MGTGHGLNNNKVAYRCNYTRTLACRHALELGWGWSRPAAHSAARLPRFSRRIGRGPRPSSTCLRAEQLTPTGPVACLFCLQHNDLVLETSAPSARSNTVECAVLYAASSPAPILEQDHELPIGKLHSCALRGRTSIAVLQVKPLSTGAATPSAPPSNPPSLPHNIWRPCLRWHQWTCPIPIESARGGGGTTSLPLLPVLFSTTMSKATLESYPRTCLPTSFHT